jgi:hypothetical protein
MKQRNRILYISVTGIKNKIYLDQSVMYRCYNFCSELEEQGYISSVINYEKFDFKMIDCYDIFIFHRPKFDAKLEEAILLLQEKDKLYFADYDDLVVGEKNYIDYPRYKLDISNEDECQKYFSNNTKALEYFSNVFVSTEELKKEISKLDETKNIEILYNSISKELLSLSDYLNSLPKVDKFFNIGFFAGSLMHKLSFESIEKALLKLLEQNSNIRVFLVGGIFEDFEIINNPAVVLIDRVSYVEYLSILSKMNLNLSPLILDNFSKCKSALKVFEAGILKVPTIVKKTTDSIRLEKSGITFIEKDEEWYEKIQEIYLQNKNNEKIEKIYSYCKNNCYIKQEVHKLINIIGKK